MPKAQPNPKVDFYFDKGTRWQKEIHKLRAILLDGPLTEELKWGVPCYTYAGSNVVLIHTFKDYCALLFHKGVLLKDEKGILIQQTKNVQAARQIRFTSAAEIERMKSTLKRYVAEAIAVEKAGKKVPYKATAEFTMPEEFKRKLDEMPDLKTAFQALTPGRQRAYLLYFSSAKQSKTRTERVAKNLDRILDGFGLDD